MNPKSFVFNFWGSLHFGPVFFYGRITLLQNCTTLWLDWNLSTKKC